ncbi:hypothetical protein Stsp01_65370 [Streptomyces sp. NBRC 13847]|uniref:hypothetical protein n=1 Tax=Streptomyces TaxID=1883 RepID=UPI0024A2463D|nr:hypothetical protein [Streptomyces sp. NBRC 13847]GLW19794.1 hypothetical protein Stsp01_65370 [Streptomyces sp. NBRC 13847]
MPDRPHRNPQRRARPAGELREQRQVAQSLIAELRRAARRAPASTANSELGAALADLLTHTANLSETARDAPIGPLPSERSLALTLAVARAINHADSKPETGDR